MPALTLQSHSLDLQPLNTLSLRSRAAAIVRVSDTSQVPALAAHASAEPGLFVLGAGSNVVLPEYMPGTVALVGLKGIRTISSMADCVIVEAAAGESWHDFVAFCVGQGLGGLENLALIPGTVGAAPVQNIGAYGIEVRERIHGVTAYDLVNRQWRQLSVEDCEFAYRDSLFKRAPQASWLITGVQFALPRQWRACLEYPDLHKRPEWQHLEPTPQRVFDAVCDIRRSKLPDPLVLPNAGSFFKNPVIDAPTYAALQASHAGLPGWKQSDGRVKLAAGWLIDQCGWKGRRMGPVGMHERHALVLVNHDDGTAEHVAALAQAIQRDVQQRFGVWLEPEPVAPQGTLAYRQPTT